MNKKSTKRKSLRQGILQSLPTEFNKGIALNRLPVPFTPYFKVPSNRKDLQLFFDKNFKIKKNKDRCFQEFCLCLYNLAKLQPGRVLVFPFEQKKHYGKLQLFSNITPFSIEVFRTFEKLGYVNIYLGYRDKGNPTMSRPTRIVPTKSLITEFEFQPCQIRYEPPAVMVMQDDGFENWRYVKTDKSRKFTKWIDFINKENKNHSIKCNFHDDEVGLVGLDLGTHLHMVFKRKLTLHGRLYSGGQQHHTQGIKANQREYIAIDGTPTIELDFEGLHPRMLYAAEGIQYDDDPYLVIHPDATKENNPALRKLCKHILLVLLNSDTRSKANSTSGSFFSTKKIKSDEAIRQRQAEIKILKATGFDKVLPLIDKFYEAHAPISKYFGVSKETGLRLMNKDGEMAVNIVYHFAKQKIVCLPVHDSFIIQIDKAEELRDKMDQIYCKFNNGFTCPIS